MLLAFRLLIGLIGLSPLFLATDSLLVRGLLTAYVACMVHFVALGVRPGEAGFLSDVIRPAVLFAILPALWIIFQALPLPLTGLRHPIWASAEAALGRTLWGSITASQGDTMIALARYFSAFGLFLVATAVSIDRQRAEAILLWLAGVTTLLALMLIVHDLGGFIFLGEISGIGPHASVNAAAALGTVLACTTVICAIERYETRRSKADFSRPRFMIIVGMAITALIVNLAAVAFFTSKPTIFSALSGLGTFVLIVGFRRIGLSSRLGFILIGIAIALPLSLIAQDLFTNAPDLSIRFLTDAPKPLVELTQRIISDTNWTGSGASTFAALLPIYQDARNPIAAIVAPTTAAGFLIELGRPAMWIAVIAAISAIALMARGALRRGRDSFFTAGGSGCAVILTLEAFCDASLATSTTLIIAMTILGLALAQSVSRSARVEL